MTTSVTLKEVVVIELDANGGGTTRLGPLTAREIWHPEKVVLSGEENPESQAHCHIYTGDVNAKIFRDATYTASSGDETDEVRGVALKHGTYIWGLWSQGTPGESVAMTVLGTKEI